MSHTNHKRSARTNHVQFLLLGLLAFASCYRTAAPAATAAPRGFYRCWAGGFDHLPAGTLTLAANGHYESYRPHGGGTYTFSAGTSTIDFLDGDYHYWEYRGIFQSAAPSGASRLEVTRERIVLMPLGAKAPIGTERPGNYQYCYLESSGAKD